MSNQRKILIEFEPVDIERYGDGRHIRRILEISIHGMTGSEIEDLIYEMKKKMYASLKIPNLEIPEVFYIER